jgi:GTP-binding protein
MARKPAPSPSVVLVGRPNVGKSTLFNRLVGERSAIVNPLPGTTRDVLRRPVEWQGNVFELVDTGGIFGASADPLQVEVSIQGLKALKGATVVLMLVDCQQGLVPADQEVAERIRQTGLPVVLVVNKVDNSHIAKEVDEFHALGFERFSSVAAEHGLGVGDLLDEVVATLPGRKGDQAASPLDDREEISIAVVGRPNVGKSSLVNLLARADRVLVNDLAGTTRDAVDTVVKWRGRRIRLVDTAGIRRPGQVVDSGRLESVSVALARRAMRRSDVAVVMIDASDGVTKRDAAIAGEAERAGCGVILAANKWDLVKGRESGFAKQFDRQIRDGLKFADYAPIIHLSALTGHRASKLMEMVAEVDAARAGHISTGELNRFLERVTRRKPPSAGAGGREVKLQYVTQVGVKPPRFVIFSNRATSLHFSYERYLKNRLRESFNFTGSPINIQVRSSHKSTRKR